MKPIQQIKALHCAFCTYHPDCGCDLDLSIHGDESCTTMDEMICPLAIKYHEDREND
jgi:hypothetical protein